MGFAGLFFLACVFSDMCAVIINVFVRLGREHAWMGVVYYVPSLVHVSLVYFSWFFFDVYRLYIFTLVYFLIDLLSR